MPGMKPRIPTRMKAAPNSVASSRAGVRPPTAIEARLSLRGEQLVGRRRRPDLALEREEDLDHDRVELRADRLAQAPARLVNGQPAAVGPVGRHRVEGVADQDD